MISAPDPFEVRSRTWPCYSPGCRHHIDDHAQPIGMDGHCLRCNCLGWDPMTIEEWDAVYAEQRARFRS